MRKKLFLIALLSVGIFSISFAQGNNAKKFFGTWSGVVEIQGQSYTAIFNFKEKDGVLTGTAESPELGAGTVALENIVVKENKIQLDIPSMRGGYEGSYNEEKKVLEGSLIMGEEAIPLILEKKKTASADEDKKISSIWEGTIDFQGTKIRLVLKIYKNEDGSFGGLIDSPDQGTTNIPAGKVIYSDEVLTFDMPAFGAEYTGKIDKTTMTAKGTFTQRGHDVPLDLKKVDKSAQQ